MKAQLSLKFDTFTAVIEDVGDLSDREEQQKIVEIVEFLRSLNDDFTRADKSPRRAEVKSQQQVVRTRTVARDVADDVAETEVDVVDDGDLWIPVSKLVVFNQDGKRSYKVLGGKYGKYGVPLYLDSCKMTPSTRRKLQGLPYGTTTLSDDSDIHAYIEHDASGKPIRVGELGEL